MLDFLFIYMGVGVACVPLSFYTLYTTDETNRREDPLVFWLAMVTICVATVFLWPALSSIMINHLWVELKRKRKQPKNADWVAVEESWKKITSISQQLDEALNGFLDGEDLNADAEAHIRSLVAEIEQEYDRWSKATVNLFTYRGTLSEEEKILGDRLYLEESPGWPRLRLPIAIEYDLYTKERKITYSTVRALFPEELDEDLTDASHSGSAIVSFMREEITQLDGDLHPWRITLSGRFTSSIKKLRGTEREKVETAVTDIMLSPTTVLGNTKTPLSNNLRDFWRYRLGDWRIIYTVDWHSKTVTMLDYTHRSKAYH